MAYHLNIDVTYQNSLMWVLRQLNVDIMYRLEIIDDLPIGFPINNIISLYQASHINSTPMER